MVLFKVVWLTVTVVHMTTAGIIRLRRYTPTDAFLTGELEGDIRNGITTLGPQNSAEIFSVEEASQTQQENSEKVPTTLNPTNSIEVTSLPPKTEKPSVSGEQESMALSSNDGVNKNGNSNTPPRLSTIGGTQTYIPQASSANKQDASGDIPSKTENIATPGNAPSTTLFSGQVSNVHVQAEDANTSAESGIAGNVASEFETQAFSSNSYNFAIEPRLGVKPSPFYNKANRIPGFEPVSVLNRNSYGSIFRTPSVQPFTSDNSDANRIRNTLAQGDIEDTDTNPIVEEAKRYFISIWNLEAHRLGMPYVEVTNVLPEVGMVYMPLINQMSSKIQSSRPVKEAAERLKAIWAENNPSPEITDADKKYIINLLSEFFNFLGLEAFRHL